MGALWETGSYAFRTASVYNPTSQIFFTLFFLLELLAPLWINAFVYMVMGRMVYFFLPNKKVCKIPGQKMGLVFVLLDIA